MVRTEPKYPETSLNITFTAPNFTVEDPASASKRGVGIYGLSFLCFEYPHLRSRFCPLVCLLHVFYRHVISMYNHSGWANVSVSRPHNT